MNYRNYSLAKENGELLLQKGKLHNLYALALHSILNCCRFVCKVCGGFNKISPGLKTPLQTRS